MIKINRAFISVQDKTKVTEFAAHLVKKGVEVYATPGTHKVLDKAGVAVSDLGAICESAPDWFSGRLKSVHPTLFASIITDPENEADVEHLESIGGKKFDLVVIDIHVGEEPPVPNKTKDAKIDESRDLGRVSLLRTATGCLNHTAVVVSTDRFKEVLDEFDSNDGKLSKETVLKLGAEACEAIADFDIAQYAKLSSQITSTDFLPERMFFKFNKAYQLRYGENPHQKAAFFSDPAARGVSMTDMNQLKGPALSYNNMCDLDSALAIALEFEKDVSVIVKHGNPTGVAIDKDVTKAYLKARDVDRVASFGSTVVFNSQVDKKTARELTNTFVEVVAAPKYTDGAVQHFKAEKKAAHMRVLEISSDKWLRNIEYLDIRSVMGGVVIQESDDQLVPGDGQIKIVTKRKPTRKELADLVMAWKVCKHVRSNTIIVVKNGLTLGIGAGQMSRMDSLKIAMEKSGEESVGAAMASDAYFPFTNVIEEAASFGIAAIIEPGGSKRDDEIIAACDEHNIALCLTGMRHFKH